MALDECEKQGPLHPLFLLAHARLAKKHEDLLLQLALLREFVARAPSLKSWLSGKEQELLKMTKMPKKDEAASSSSASELELQYHELVKQIRQDYKSDASGSMLQPLEELMQMVGLDEVKQVAMSLYSDNLADKRLRENGFAKAVQSKALNFLFVGNPGTGKTVSAELFGKILQQSGARAAYKFVKMTAGEALRKGAKQFAAEVAVLTGGRKGVGPPPEQVLRKGMPVEVVVPKTGEKYPGKISQVDAQKNVYSVDYSDGTQEESVPRNRILAIGESKNVGGVLFVDEAYDLDPKNNTEGRAILNEIMSVAEEFRDSVTIILAGYKDDIKQKLVAFNAGMSSRFKTVNFADFSQDQIAAIWSKNCKDNAFKCERDVTNVAARRIARGIGRKGFGNARSVRQLFERAASEAKMRFRPGKEPPQILVEDVIGKPPDRTKNAELDKWLRKLEQLTGLSKVKQAVNQLLETAKANYDKELRGEEIDLLMLNRLFLGNPGTGKTTVAEIYGKILTTLKFLSNGELMMKVGSDFVGDKVGEAQTKTRAILEAAEGKVLLIDEAYVLDDDLYGKQALDTIVEKVQATPGADICVIMAGYDAPMMKMLREQNPGLSSRFDPRYALEFSDYSDEELLKILTDEVNKGRIEMPIEVKIHAVEQLAKRRSMANFGNARAVKTLVMNAKSRLTERVKRGTDETTSLKRATWIPIWKTKIRIARWRSCASLAAWQRISWQSWAKWCGFEKTKSAR